MNIQAVKYIYKLVGRCYSWFVAKGLAKPMVIVNMDGGICSQMYQYLIGRWFEKKGYKVEFCLDFFVKNGMDCDGRQVRNYDMPKAFKAIDIKVVSLLDKLLYSRCFYHKGTFPSDCSSDWLKLSAPIFLDGYFYDDPVVWSEFHNVFKMDASVLSDHNKSLYNGIMPDDIAIHVRRGDLSKEMVSYGKPATIEYFENAINIFLERGFKSSCFYFFSDEVDYVYSNLIPLFGDRIRYVIVDNGAENGYQDLVLMSRFNHIITSKGSLGKYAAYSNLNIETIIMVQDDPNIGPLKLLKDKIIYCL